MINGTISGRVQYYDEVLMQKEFKKVPQSQLLKITAINKWKEVGPLDLK